MTSMIKRELFTLEMVSLTSQMKSLKLNEKAVALLNDFWHKVCGNAILPKTIEFKCELDGIVNFKRNVRISFGVASQKHSRIMSHFKVDKHRQN